MTTTELLVFFAIAMLAIALLAIAVDWVGRPIRRRFIPKMYRFPEELGSEPPVDPSLTGWSDQYFVVPEGLTNTNGHVLDWPDVNAAALDEDSEVPVAVAADAAPFDFAAEDSSAREVEAPESDQPDSGLPERALGWQRGKYVYNLVGNGAAPSADIIRTRFWKNVSGTDYAAIFGVENCERMSKGKAPTRRNPRTHEDESMQLTIMSFEEAEGRPPQPRWPSVEIDPFATQ